MGLNVPGKLHPKSRPTGGGTPFQLSPEPTLSAYCKGTAWAGGCPGGWKGRAWQPDIVPPPQPGAGQPRGSCKQPCSWASGTSPGMWGQLCRAHSHAGQGCGEAGAGPPAASLG